jgi:hypothetical protein
MADIWKGRCPVEVAGQRCQWGRGHRRSCRFGVVKMPSRSWQFLVGMREFPGGRDHVGTMMPYVRWLLDRGMLFAGTTYKLGNRYAKTIKLTEWGQQVAGG